MIFLVGIAALFAVKQSQKNVTQNTTSPGVSGAPSNPNLVPRHVIKNSVGGALSAALGNANRSPSYYSTGTPGTRGITLPPSSSAVYYKPLKTSLPFTPSVSNPTGGSKTVPYAGQSGVSQNNPGVPIKGVTTSVSGKRKVTYSLLVNHHQTPRPIQGPEQPTAFWTKMPYKRVGKK